MTTRRDFLKYLSVTLGVAATPKIIFDMGKNLYKIKPAEIEEIEYACVKNIVVVGGVPNIMYTIERKNAPPEAPIERPRLLVSPHGDPLYFEAIAKRHGWDIYHPRKSPSI